MIQGAGLNGFWGDFWNGLKSRFGIGQSNPEQANNSSFGSLFAKWFKKIVDIATAGVLKIDYIPTGAELLLYNRIKLQLNNFVINELDKIDAAADKLQAINNAIRKLQLIQEFVDSRKVNASNQFQVFLSEQIASIIQTFELTIEDILKGNNVIFSKVETPLVPNQSDNYPIDLKPTNTTPFYGFQYAKEGNQPIETNVPTTVGDTASVNPKPINAVTDVVAGGEQTKKSSMLVPALLVIVAIVAALIPSKNEKEN